MTDKECEVIIERVFDELVPGNESNIECYTKHAEQYERGMIGVKYLPPEWCAETALRHVNTGNKRMQALDVCVGTGLASKYLTENGFEGDIDGVDGNLAMLQQAAKKNIFRNLIQHIIAPDTRLPFDDHTYDVIVCSGAFSAGHVSPRCLPELFRVLKFGGSFAFNTTNFNINDDEANRGDLNKADLILKELVDTGVCELVEMTVSDSLTNISSGFKYYKGNVDKLRCYRKTTRE